MRNPRELPRHEAQLRELARRLVEDEHLADDLVQETYVSALERSDPPEKPRRWLREMLRLKARHARESEASRATRERVAAQQTVTTHDADREELDAALAALREELERLEEPYRTTLRVRFVEGTPPRMIAARMGLPVRTVNTRITRGVARLRARLDRRLGATWLPLFALALRGRRAPLGLPRLHSGAAAAVAVAAAGAVLVGAWLARPAPERVAGLELARSADERSTVVAPAAQTLRDDARAPLSSAGRASVPAPSAARSSYSGIVTDLAGAPLAGVEVVLDEGECAHDGAGLESFAFELSRAAVARTTSGADGAWTLAVDEGAGGRLVARGDGYRAVIGELVPAPGGEKPLVLVAAPERTIAGVVVDGEGGAVAGATVTAMPSAAYLAELARRERTWVPLLPSAATDADGAFELASYDLDEGRIEVAKEGYVTTARVAPEGPLDLRIELRRSTATTLAGLVVDGRGAPLGGATVVAGNAHARTESDGTFRLGPDGLFSADVLWAVAPDRCPVRVELTRADGGALAAPEDLVLTLAEPSRAIEGVVVDAAGRPAAGATVWCADATHLGGVRSTLFAERFVFAGDGEWGMPFATSADDEGRFRIPYLADRAYRIGAVRLATQVSTVSEPVPSGTTELVLRLPTDDPRVPVAGLVLARDGRPLCGVRVSVKRTTLDAKIGAGGNLRAALTFDSVETDGDGWFVFDALPLRGLYLAFEGGEVLPDQLDVPADASRERLEVVLARRSRVRVCLSTGRRVDHVALVDRRGIKLPLFDAAEYAQNSGWSVRTDVAVGGRPSVLVIAPDTAVALVAYGGGAIVERVPVELSPETTLDVDL